MSPGLIELSQLGYGVGTGFQRLSQKKPFSTFQQDRNRRWFEAGSHPALKAPQDVQIRPLDLPQVMLTVNADDPSWTLLHLFVLG